MAVLGYPYDGSVNATTLQPGRMYVSQFTLTTPSTLTELHGWFNQGTATVTVRIVIYADSAGSPGALIAYTNALTLSLGSSDVELSQSGFNVALTTGDYWIGFSGLGPGTTGDCRGENTGGIHLGKTTGASDPPNDPFGSTDTSGTRKHSVWAVVTPGASNYTWQFTGPGFQEFLLPVSATATTVSVQVRRTNAYSPFPRGTLPALQILANGGLGISAQTIVDTGAAGGWNTLTAAAFTPTATGWVTVRICSFDGTGAGVVSFDNLSVT